MISTILKVFLKLLPLNTGMIILFLGGRAGIFPRITDHLQPIYSYINAVIPIIFIYGQKRDCMDISERALDSSGEY